MSEQHPSHSWVACCDRLPLFERTTVETWSDSENVFGYRVRVCRPGTGCWLDPWPALEATP